MLRLFATILLIAAAVAGLWYQGLLADFYATYPELRPADTFRTGPAPLLIAHRGDEMQAPENTLEAFALAIDRNVEYLEVDMRLTSDGVPVVLHDVSLDRTTDGVGPIEQLTYAEVRQLDAGSWFGPEFAGAQVPTVAEVLELANGSTCILADIKPVPNYALIKMLRDFAANNDSNCLLIALMNGKADLRGFEDTEFPPDVQKRIDDRIRSRQKLHNAQMAAFRRYWPDFPLTLSYRPGTGLQENFVGYPNTIGVHVSMTQATPELVEGLHAAGYLVFTLVPIREDTMKSMDNSKEIYARLNAAGVDALFVGDLDDVEEYFRSLPANTP